MWHSLVARFVRDEEAAGSNPVIPTIDDNRDQLDEISGWSFLMPDFCGIMFSFLKSKQEVFFL